MILKEAIEHLSQELGVEMPKPDPQKAYLFKINSKVSVLIRDLAPGFSLHAQASPCPANKREDLFMRLMRANFLGQGTGGARIGLDADEKSLTLSQGFPYEMNYPHFKESVEDFVNYVVYWREEIAQFEREK
ncbi:MAG: sycE [Parachlamydiales bacterium]|nr:sycE [Parachlamydiales bacterium]